MLYFIVLLLAVVHLGYAAVGFSTPCIDMDLAQLCEQATVCQYEVPDLDILCAAIMRRSHEPQIQRTVLQATVVSYYDATVPVILDLTTNITVAPGGTFRIECLAEGAPTPYMEISHIDYANYEPEVEDENASEVMHGVVQLVYTMPDAQDFDEGWYRCVTKNSQGVVFQDTYVSVADLCVSAGCEAQGLMCEANYELGMAECVCPYCSDQDYEDDPYFYCGSNCATYESLCSVAEENCLLGTNVTVFSHSDFCDWFSLPEFVVIPSELEMTVKEGATIELTCQASPAGETPGPPPTIGWYDDWGTWLGDGEVLSYLVEYDVSIRCVAEHCNGSFLQTATIEGAVVAIHLEEVQENTKEHTGASCQIMGDSYISTYDDLWYKQDGVCSYVVSMDCQLAQWFIYGRFTQCGTATCLETVTLYYGRTMLELQRGWLINRNGEKVPVILNEVIEVATDIFAEFDGEFLTLIFGDNNQIRWNGFDGAQIIVEPGLRTCGLCGDNNGQSSDDFLSRRRGGVNERDDFISSWALRYRNYACYFNDHAAGSEDGQAVCADVFDNEHISPCHGLVDTSPYVTACTTSYATNSYADLRAECNALQNYVLLCQTEGLAMTGWREDTNCMELEDLQQFTINQGCPQENPPV